MRRIFAARSTPFYFAILLLSIGLLSACATTTHEPAAPQNLRVETDDLRLVSDTALQLASEWGAENLMVIFDIDNTLLAMEQDLGSDQWYYWQKDLENAEPCNPAVVVDRFAVQGAVFYASAMRATQPDAAAQVRRLQDAGIAVFALTSRGTDYRLQTFRELRRNGFSLWSTAPGPRHGYPGNFTPSGGERPARYEDGVFLTAGQHKGKMLKALLDKTDTPYPTIIVMVDDKPENLEAVEETFDPLDPVVHAWRYTREDAVVSNFDASQADQDWRRIEPALRELQNALGPDHFELPENAVKPSCEPAERP